MLTKNSAGSQYGYVSYKGKSWLIRVIWGMIDDYETYAYAGAYDEKIYQYYNWRLHQLHSVYDNCYYNKSSGNINIFFKANYWIEYYNQDPNGYPRPSWFQRSSEKVIVTGIYDIIRDQFINTEARYEGDGEWEPPI